MSSWVSGNRYLSTTEQQNNAVIIRDYLLDRGWTINAVCGVLGNMQYESTINPGIWESLRPFWRGYGLVQWTPYTKYTEWAGADYASGERQLERIIYESENGLQWFANPEVTPSTPPISFADYTRSDLPPDTLARYWVWYYEHPGDPYATSDARAAAALAWYEYLEGVPYVPGLTEEALILMYRRKKRVQKQTFA